MNWPLRYMSKTFRHRLRLISVDGLFWANRQIRLAQKIGDPAKLREGLTARKEYLQNIRQLDEERRHGRCSS